MKSRLFSILLLCIALAWPAIRNGQPFIMSDTTTYVRGADAAVYRLTGKATMWTGTFIDRYERPADTGRPKAAAAAATPDPQNLPVTIAGRSIFYGILLYLSDLFGNFWAAAVLQILVVATAITLAAESLCRAFGRTGPNMPGTILIAAITGLSPAGYFAGYMMPDIFLPLAILAFCEIAFLWRFTTRAERMFWVALLLAAMLFHTLDLVIITSVLLALAAIRRITFWRDNRQPILVIIAAILAAWLCQEAVKLVVTRATSAAPVDVPFITARIIVDGPGRDYLEAHCPQARFRLCDYRDRLHENSDTFLWSYDPRLGVFSAVPPKDRRLIASQQTAFVTAVARDRPMATARSMLASVLRQFGAWKLSEFNYSQIARDNFTAKLPQPALDDIRRSSAYARVMPVRAVEITTPLFMLAAVPLLFAAFRRTSTAALYSTMISYLCVVIGAIVLNSILCGAISTPHDRYQMRLIWLLPLFAGMIWTASAASFRAKRE